MPGALSPAASEPEHVGPPGPDWARRPQPPHRRRRLWALVGAGVLVVLLLLGGALVSWHFSSQVLVPDHDPWPQDISVEAVRPGEIVLERTKETARPGYLGIAWQGGHARVGPLTGADGDTVSRRLEEVEGYLPAGLKVAIADVYAGDPRQARGLPFSDVEVDGELGPMPAWRIPPRPGARSGDTWAIFVHGINGNPEEALRLAPLMHREGLTSLLITYREDLGAPESPDGYHHMGLTEWRDLEAAARYALDNGARRLVLVGYSMGGAIVTQFIEHSDLSGRVAALILDAPALDWQKILEFNATEMGLPGFFSLPVQAAIGVRIDADWTSLDAIEHTGDFRLPVLLFHGTEDEVVPIETSDEFAAELPDWVTYYRVPRAGHTDEWNVDPPLYEERVTRFLDRSLR